MVNVVPAGRADKTPPRVMPKVFADVPTQKELDKAQRSKKTLTGWVVVLMLLVVGAGAALTWEFLIGRPAIAEEVDTAKKEAKQYYADRQKAQDDLKKEKDNNLKLSAQHRPFEVIATAEKEIVDYKNQIDQRLTQYPAARDRTRIDYKDHWKAYDSAAIWTGKNKTEVEQDLKNKSVLLTALLKKIDEIKPPVTTPGPDCTDATRCAPTTPARPN